MAETYKIVRFYFNGGSRGGGGKRTTVATGLTLEEAQEHCKDPETSSKTCTKAAGKRRTKTHGPWFDGYYKES